MQDEKKSQDKHKGQYCKSMIGIERGLCKMSKIRQDWHEGHYRKSTSSHICCVLIFLIVTETNDLNRTVVELLLPNINDSARGEVYSFTVFKIISISQK